MGFWWQCCKGLHPLACCMRAWAPKRLGCECTGAADATGLSHEYESFHATNPVELLNFAQSACILLTLRATGNSGGSVTHIVGEPLRGMGSGRCLASAATARSGRRVSKEFTRDDCPVLLFLISVGFSLN